MVDEVERDLHARRSAPGACAIAVP